MPTEEDTLVQRVELAFQELCGAAADLNAISDELGKCTNVIDEGLKKLNVGVTAWVDISRTRDENDYFAVEDLGYTKWGGKWGLVLRSREGFPGDIEEQGWVFNEAPRALRIAAIDRIPDLLVALSAEATKMSATVLGQLATAQQVAKAITKTTAEVAPKKRPIAKSVIPEVKK
jgi:hypothetical protein